MQTLKSLANDIKQCKTPSKRKIITGVYVIKNNEDAFIFKKYDTIAPSIGNKKQNAQNVCWHCL